MTDWTDELTDSVPESDEPTGLDALSALWDRYAPLQGTGDALQEAMATLNREGPTASGQAAVREAFSARIVPAQRLAETVLNSFVRDRRYHVEFDSETPTAATEMSGSGRVRVNPRVLADPSLTAKQAAIILTGYVVHESTHPRYGAHTFAAVQRAYPQRALPAIASNVLDDVRGEANFARDYPGLSEVFDPMLDYVVGDNRIAASTLQPKDIAIAAVRYADKVDWTDSEIPERDWWQEWAKRYTADDSTTTHLDGVRAALERWGSEEDKRVQAEREAGWAQGQPTKEGSLGEGCVGHGMVERADANGSGAVENGMARKIDAQAQIASKEPYMQYDGNGRKVYVNKADHAWTDDLRVPASVSGSVREAFLRSRTGHTSFEHSLKRGRLDGSALHRIARGDTRLFEQHRAVSQGKTLVWILVDTSGSMRNYLDVAAQTTKALADASLKVPDLRMEVMGWTSGAGPAGGMRAHVAQYWRTGEPTRNVGRIREAECGGTPDAAVMGWAVQAIRRSTHRDESPVILMVSDGMGSSDLVNRVSEGRRQGIDIRGIAFGAIPESEMLQRYGRDGYIRWQGSILATARPMADLITSIIRKRRPR